MKKERQKIRYEDLSWAIKAAIVFSWIGLIYFGLAFLTGIIQGLLGL